MEYLKGTPQQLEAYNDIVTLGENYQGATTKWAEVIEIEGEHYLAFNEKYPSELEIIDLNEEKVGFPFLFR